MNEDDYSDDPSQAVQRGSPPGLKLQPQQKQVYAGNDYSDEPNKSGGQNNEAASGKLLEKFSKLKPTRTKDGSKTYFRYHWRFV